MPRAVPCLVLVALAAVACKGNTPAPGSPGGSDAGTISGSERIGWDQPASSTVELSTFRYELYVDGAPTSITGVSCGDTATAAGFACSGNLPALTPGQHTLELATIANNGGLFESARSAPLHVTVQEGATTGAAAQRPAWDDGPAGATAEGVALAIERLAEGLVEPADAAVAPDGRLFVAERSGRLRTVDARNRRLPSPATPFDVEGGTVLSLALDPAFERTHFVYVVYAAAGTERPVCRLARFREVDGVLGERAILVNELAAAATPAAASLRFAADGRLLVALANSGADASASSFDGKLLRLEPSGATPRDQNGTPVILSGIQAPAGIAWDAVRSSVWLMDRANQIGTLSRVAIAPPAAPDVAIIRRMAARDTGAVAVYDGDLLPALRGDVLVASERGSCLLRLHTPDDAHPRQMTMERLLEDRVGPIRLVTVAGDGAVYFVTPDAVGRMGPAVR